MAGPIPAGYETDDEDFHDEMYDGPQEKQHVSFYSGYNSNVKDEQSEEPIDWQSAIQSSMNESQRLIDHNDTTLHSANSKLGESNVSGDTTLNNTSNGVLKESNYDPMCEYKTSDGFFELDKLNDRNLPDEDVDDNQSLPPHGAGPNLKVYGDLELFLCYIKEDDLIELFDKHEVTFRQLLTCTEQDLINIGIAKVGIRKKILEAVSQVHARKWEPTSLTDLTAQDIYSAPGVYLVLSDIKKHQEYINCTIEHLKSKIQSDDEILELGKDFVGIKKIAQETCELTEVSQNVTKTLVDFANYIKKEKLDLPQLGPANNIDQDYINNTFRKSAGVAGYTLLATIVIGAVAYKVAKW